MLIDAWAGEAVEEDNPFMLTAEDRKPSVEIAAQDLVLCSGVCSVLHRVDCNSNPL